MYSRFVVDTSLEDEKELQKMQGHDGRHANFSFVRVSLF